MAEENNAYLKKANILQLDESADKKVIRKSFR